MYTKKYRQWNYPRRIDDAGMRQVFYWDYPTAVTLEEVKFPSFRADIVEFREEKEIKSLIGYEIKSDKETYFYKTNSGIKFNTPLSVSKSFLEKYTSTPLNNISSEYIMIDNISNNIINTSDGNQIIIKNPKTFLDELIN